MRRSDRLEQRQVARLSGPYEMARSPETGLDDYDQTLARARALVSVFAQEPSENSNIGTREFSVRGPDGNS